MERRRVERIKVPPSTWGPIRKGHPWVFRDVTVRSKPGEPVLLLDEHGRAGAWGVADEGPIAVRVLGLDVPASLDVGDVVVDRVLRADALRARLAPPDTDTWRVVHGEGDGLPGLVVDRYGPVAIVRLYAAAWVPYLDRLVAALAGLPWVRHVARRLGVERVDGARGGLVSLHGPPVPEQVVVSEEGMKLLVQPAVGQKTGMFLDQRHHRRMVRDWSRNTGLAANLFSYHGGFSVAAALGGARRVLTVDIAPDAIADARENFRLNGLDPDAHGFEVADAFAWTHPRPLDLLVVDPPALARDRKSAGAARAAYRKLHKRLGPLVAVDGLLASSSCTAWLDQATWQAEIADGLAGTGAWSWLWTSGAPPDHPVAVGHPEGAYLKFALLRRRG
jgi:23S rRNA (cytosine1962-C5)-methyltransferase